MIVELPAGRSSESRYTISNYKGPDREQISHQWTSHHSVGFNAGVMVMSLKKMRAQSKRYDAVVKRVAWEYGNDDQVVLNYWCSLEPGNGTFTQLDHAWNVFHASDPADPQLHADSSMTARKNRGAQVVVCAQRRGLPTQTRRAFGTPMRQTCGANRRTSSQMVYDQPKRPARCCSGCTSSEWLALVRQEPVS